MAAVLAAADAFFRAWVASGTPFVARFQRACGVTAAGPTRPVVHLLMVLGASLGNELFFISFLPFLFWEVDSGMARRVVLQWGTSYWLGQALKDLVQMPRPPAQAVVDASNSASIVAVWRTPRHLNGGGGSSSGSGGGSGGSSGGGSGSCAGGSEGGGPTPKLGVVRLERHYETEGGMPSTHAMNALSMPWLVVLLSRERVRQAFAGAAPDDGAGAGAARGDVILLLGAAAWTVLCVTSRLYMGVHCPADLVVGAALGLVIFALHASLGGAVDAWVLTGDFSWALLPLAMVVLSVLYPRPRTPRWVSTPGDTVLILGVVAGVCSSTRLCAELGATDDAARALGRGGAVGTVARVLCGFALLVLTRAVVKPPAVFVAESLLGPLFVDDDEDGSVSASRGIGGAAAALNAAAAAHSRPAGGGDGGGDSGDAAPAGTLRRRKHVELAYAPEGGVEAAAAPAAAAVVKAAATPSMVVAAPAPAQPKPSGLRISVPPLPTPTPTPSPSPPARAAARRAVPAAQRYAVELPVKFLVYFLVGFNTQFTAKLLFQQLGPLGKDFGLRL